MEIRDLLKSPQLVVVYAITILYVITFSLAAVIALPTDSSPWTIHGIHQVAQVETDNLDLLHLSRNSSSG